MAKKILSQASYSVTNVQGLPVQVKGQASLVQQTFDKASLDQRTYNNSTLLSELQSEAVNDSGANAIGAEGTFGADNVGDEIKAIKTVTDGLESGETALDARVTQNEADIVSLDGRVTTNESDISTLQTADTQNVKLTGNQTISDLKTYNTLPQSVDIPSVDADLVNKKYVDDLAPLNIPDGSIKNVKLSNDPEDIKNAVYGSFHADADRYVGYTQTILACEQSEESITLVSGAYSQSNVKIGDDTITASGAGAAIKATFTAKDISKLLNSESVETIDFVTVPLTITGTLPTSITIEISSSTTDDTDEYEYVFTSLSAFDVYKVKLSNMTQNGSPDLTNIQRIEVFATGGDGTTNIYLDKIQFIKKSPDGDFPSAFQRNGVTEFTINSGEWYVGLEFGKNVIKELNAGSVDPNALESNIECADFTATAKISSGGSNDIGYLTWYTDDNNYIECGVNNNLLRLRVRESASNTDKTTDLTVATSDLVKFVLSKNDVNVMLTAYDSANNLYILKGTTALSTGKLSLGTRSAVTEPTYYSEISITELQHAYHADVAEVAKTVKTLYKNGVFTAEELEYGQYGIDTANNRLYIKYSNTQVIYFTGTVV